MHLHSHTMAIASPGRVVIACKRSKSLALRQLEGQPAHDFFPDFSLAHGWPQLRSVRIDYLDLIRLPAEGRGAFGHAVGDDQIAALAFKLGFCVGREVLRFGCKTNYNLWP